ncbi:DUF1425 domain-containing protein [Candidatus Venteria ishoeyi]|uniref:DUF1425 domain-containing protein n=1 Tax=Candidatus Venteria ishoeyi TaxID=1899563 RepID=A0A1H6FFS5_9GAMM|nr:DUF1425 domain-containing protein [Candidatus Venteria ishoeyi]SEH07885.1 Uncharacterised protein [Candidatus Venteria ishoeyi]
MKLKLFIVLTGLFLVTACTGPDYSAGSEGRLNAQGQANISQYPNSDVFIRQLKGEWVGDQYRARVIIENSSSMTETMQYQFNWYNAAGDELDIDGHAWTPVTVYGHNQKTLTSLSADPGAVNFRVVVRHLSGTTTFKTNFFGIK